MRETRSIMRVAWSLALAAVLAVGIVACGGQAQSSSSGQAQSSSSEQAQSSQSGQAQAGELYGSPWVTSIFAGNLPSEAPSAKSDLYLHYGYDFIAGHQDGAGSPSVRGGASGELQQFVTTAIKGEAGESGELSQLRIFYDQAADLETLEAAGADELRPYLKRVADTTSLKELEAVLLSPDFPFSPWIDVTVEAMDMKSTMCAKVQPHMLFADTMTGPIVYKDSDDPAIASAYASIRAEKTAQVQVGLTLVSLADDGQAAKETSETYFNLEKTYGSKCMPAAEGLDAEYGAFAGQQKLFSKEELAASCPNFPIAETIAKLGKDAGEGVIVSYPDWLTAFNDVWTEENFKLLRGMTEVKMLSECAPFLKPSFFSNARQFLGHPEPTAEQNAWAACNKTSTFAQLLAKIYADQALGEQAFTDLTNLTNSLIDSYIDLVGKTTWLNEQSRENVMDKIDNMALNILYPDGGYFDYSELKLTPSSEGGTLFQNYLAVKEYNNKQEAALIGQPARASASWLQYEPTIQNCAYDAVSNSISIFPGYVTSVMYGKDMSREELLGGIGFTIAHEISHAFDYNGSQLNAYGQPTPVFTEEDVSEFTGRCAKLADRYSALEISPGQNVNGSYTVVEAMADMSGLQATVACAKSEQGADLEKLFGQFAYKWAAVYPATYADMLRIDLHPPANVRVNVSAQMRDEFYDTFGAQEGDAMYLAPGDRVTVWGE